MPNFSWASQISALNHERTQPDILDGRMPESPFARFQNENGMNQPPPHSSSLLISNFRSGEYGEPKTEHASLEDLTRNFFL